MLGSASGCVATWLTALARAAAVIVKIEEPGASLGYEMGGYSNDVFSRGESALGGEAGGEMRP